MTPPNEQVRAFRLTRHYLGARAPKKDLVKVIGAIGGVQAQVMGAARLALWVRVVGLTADTINDVLLNGRALVRTWAMRGTLHLLPAEEFRVYLAGLRAAWRAREQFMARLGIDGLLADRVVRALELALTRGPLPRRDLSTEIHLGLGKKVASAADRAWASAVEDGAARMMLEFACSRGVLCLGPSRGQEIAFVRVDQWLPKAPPAPPVEEAEEQVLRRYLRAFGPATVADFAHWSGMHAGDASTIMRRLEGETVHVAVDGIQGVMLREDVRKLKRATPVHSVRLLPNFDTFLLGHKDKTLILDAVRHKDVYRKAGWSAATVLVDGRVAGTWTRKETRRGLILELQSFGKLPRAAIGAVESEARDLARFLGLRSAEVRAA